jgi:hypothetical protein
MSYEILLLPRSSDQDWADALRADEQEGTEGDEETLQAGVALFRRIEARVREQLTEPVETWVAEEVGGDVYGELTAAASGLQVELYDRSASVSLMPGAARDAEEAQVRARAAIDIVEQETGYQAYDPQRQATFDGTFALQDLPGDGGDPAVLDGEVVAHPGDDESPREPRRDPRRDPTVLRRRGNLYLIIGVVLTALGLFRFGTGDGNWITWFLLGIGIFDLVGGAFMRSLAQKMEAGDPQDAAETS